MAKEARASPIHLSHGSSIRSTNSALITSQLLYCLKYCGRETENNSVTIADLSAVYLSLMRICQLISLSSNTFSQVSLMTQSVSSELQLVLRKKSFFFNLLLSSIHFFFFICSLILFSISLLSPNSLVDPIFRNCCVELALISTNVK